MALGIVITDQIRENLHNADEYLKDFFMQNEILCTTTEDNSFHSVYSNLASKGVEFACLTHGLSFPFIPFFDDPFDGCFRPLSGADMDELEAAERSRDSTSSATDDALPNDDMVVTDARLDEVQ